MDVESDTTSSDSEDTKKVKIEGNAGESDGFSFLALMGREKPTTVKKEEQPIKPIFTTRKQSESSKRAEQSLALIKEALRTGQPGDLSDSVFAVDMDELRSVSSSFRQHKVDHITAMWPKLRKNFILIYKKQRKMAVKAQKAKAADRKDKAPAKVPANNPPKSPKPEQPKQTEPVKRKRTRRRTKKE